LCVADWKRGRAVSANDSAHAARQADDYGLGGLAEFERHCHLTLPIGPQYAGFWERLIYDSVDRD
jgi:hypothetical protein